MNYEWRRDRYRISTDKSLLDVPMIHEFLSRRSYWALGRTIEQVRRTIEHSIVFGLYDGERQIGFSRVVTDYVSMAWLGDVFILEDARAGGLGKWLIGAVMSHPELQDIRRWVLTTKDAHGLYKQFGWEPLPEPERFMHKFRQEKSCDRTAG